MVRKKQNSWFQDALLYKEIHDRAIKEAKTTGSKKYIDVIFKKLLKRETDYNKKVAYNHLKVLQHFNNPIFHQLDINALLKSIKSIEIQK